MLNKRLARIMPRDPGIYEPWILRKSAYIAAMWRFDNVELVITVFADTAEVTWTLRKGNIVSAGTTRKYADVRAMTDAMSKKLVPTVPHPEGFKLQPGDVVELPDGTRGSLKAPSGYFFWNVNGKDVHRRCIRFLHRPQKSSL